MKTKVKAITSFMHGRIHATPDAEPFEVTKGEADELEKAGLVQVVTEQDAAPQTTEAAQEPVADQKMDDEPQNKMEAAPENKSTGGKKATAKKAD